MSRAPKNETDAGLTDGRVQRGARNRERIVEAMLELIRQGKLRPTAEQVAERAGVGTRTVFRHFDDMDSLFSEMNIAIRKEVRPLIEGIELPSSLRERVALLAQRRGKVFEQITPFRRAAAIQVWRSKFLKHEHRTLSKSLRDDLLRVLPELLEQSDARLATAVLACSFEAWLQLRDDQNLSESAAVAAVEGALLACLGEE